MRPKNNIENKNINLSTLKTDNFKNNYFRTTYNTNFTNYTEEIQKNFKKIHSNKNIHENLNNSVSRNNGYKKNIFESKDNNENDYKKLFYSTINYNNYNINKKDIEDINNKFNQFNKNINKTYEIKNNDNNDNNKFSSESFIKNDCVNNIDSKQITYKSKTPLKRIEKSKTSKNSIKKTNNLNGVIVIEGVCSNCINKELMKLHNLHPKEKKLDEDPFSIQAKKNIIQKQNIQLKVNRNYKLTQKAIENMKIKDEKTKLINENQNADFYLFRKTFDPLKKRTLERFLKNQELLLNREYNGYNKEKDDFYNKPNPVTNGSVDAIGRTIFKNKYLPTKKQYTSFLTKQIENKEIRKKKEKEKDIEGEKYIYNKNLKEFEREKYIKKNYLKKINLDFLNENKRLMQQKEYRNKMNKTCDLAIEKDNIEKIKEEERKKKEEMFNKKNKIKNELINDLDKQIKLKNKKSYDFGTLGKSDKYDICCEPIHVDEFGRCIKCCRIMKKVQIHPKKEYDVIKKEEIEKMK